MRGGAATISASGNGAFHRATGRGQGSLCPVTRADLQAGDLVFMHLSAKELHVAIALDRQLFVHAPSSGGRVRIDSLLAEPYAKGFIGARRVVSSPAPP